MEMTVEEKWDLKGKQTKEQLFCAHENYSGVEMWQGETAAENRINRRNG